MAKEVILYRNGSKISTNFSDFKIQLEKAGCLDNLVWGEVIDNKLSANSNYNSLTRAYDILGQTTFAKSITGNGVVMRADIKDPLKDYAKIKNLANNYGFFMFIKI